MKKIFPIIVALLLAVVASWGIVNWSKKLTSGDQWVSFVAAKGDLAPDHVITDADLGLGQVPLPIRSQQNTAVWSFISSSFVTQDNRNTLIGRVISREIKDGYPILDSSLKPMVREQHRVDWKSMKIADGKRAIAIPVNAVRAVNGLVEVGDHVDVLVTLDVPTKGQAEQAPMTIPIQMGGTTQNMKVPSSNREKGEPMTFFLLQDVEVLTIGTKTYRSEEIDSNDPMAAMAAKEGSGGGAITVALTPDQALMLAFSNSGGGAEFTLVLRKPGDQSLYDTVNKPPASYKELMTMIGAKP